MSEEIQEENSFGRRRFLSAATATVAAVQLGWLGAAKWGSAQAAQPRRALPVEGDFPSLGGATGWLHSPPLTAAGLRGKVVLVEFWTYTCINWLRTLPSVRAWAEKYKDHGLVVIGVHTPEFSFEKSRENVRRAAQEMRIEYPIALDNNQGIWNAFGNEYWPALYFIDTSGHIRHHQFGEGQYGQSEGVIQQLLAEAGHSGLGSARVSGEAHGAEAAADWDNLESDENYVGYARTQNFASPGGAVLNQPHWYAAPGRLRLNQWGLTGDWTVGRESVALNKAGGRIAYRFHARDLHLVMGPARPGAFVRFRVLLNGKPPGAAHGADCDRAGFGTARDPRLYQLLRQTSPITDQSFEIEFLEAGVEAFAFTFG